MPRNVLTSTACVALALIVTAGCATTPRPSTTALAPPAGRNADDGAVDCVPPELSRAGNPDMSGYLDVKKA
ncbi:hypothetical protein ABZ260_40880 [Streptosporangium sp. NPDC006013]|uniref:hypothetical protein n=1 Tax=Streptosporangium sp. NPDC006013 TaxID=3155596 RepID=UPI0033ABD3F8